MEGIITFLGRSYILFGFIVGILSYYYSIRQYKYNKIYYTRQSGKKRQAKKEKLSHVKSNMTQYIDTNELNKEINCPIITFINTKKTEPIRLTEDKIIIGRSKTDDIIIDNPNVSRSHCVIFKKNKKYFLELSATKNPIYINGKKMIKSQEELADGDTISLVNANISFNFIIPKMSISNGL